MSSHRRTFLKRGIAVTVGAAALAEPAAAGDADPREENEGELPNRNVTVTDVHPFTGQPSTARTGEWLWHNLAWVGDDPAGLRDILDRTTDVVHVDGERIDDPDQYWGEVREAPADLQADYVVYWEYYTPPKEPGTYPFSWQVRYDDGRTSPVFSNPYDVLAGGDGRGADSAAGSATGGDGAPVDGVRPY